MLVRWFPRIVTILTAMGAGTAWTTPAEACRARTADAGDPAFASIDAAIAALKSDPAQSRIAAGRWIASQEPNVAAKAVPAAIALLGEVDLSGELGKRVIRLTPATVAAEIIFRAGENAFPHCLAAYDSPNAVLRCNMIVMIGRMDHPEVPAALIRAAKDPDLTVRSQAVGAMVRYQRQDIVEALLAAMDDPASRLRMQAAFAAGYVAAPAQPPGPRKPGAPHPVSNVLRNRVAKRVAELLEKDDDVDVRMTAARTLGQLKTSDFAPLVRALKDPKVRLPAVQALAELADPRTTPALLDVLTAAPPGMVSAQDEEHARVAAVRGVGASADVRATKVLAKLLDDPGLPHLHAAVAESLGQIGDRRGVPALIDRLKSPQPPPEDTEMNRRFPPHEQVQAAAAKALGAIRDPRAVEPLITVLSDGTNRGIQEAAKALGTLGDPAAVDPLARLLFASEENQYQADAAGEALSRIRHPRVVRVLIEGNQRAAKQGYATMVARSTVDRITGSDLRFSGTDAVAAWWAEHEQEFKE